LVRRPPLDRHRSYRRSPAAHRRCAVPVGPSPRRPIRPVGERTSIEYVDDQLRTGRLAAKFRLNIASTAGPLTLDGDIATGYAHTPVGALIAAANISTRYFLALDSDYRQAAEAMIAPGVGRDAWIALRAKESHPTADPAGTYAQIAGFNFLSYSLADSVVQVATRAADGSLQAVPEHVVWVNGDWRLVLSADGGQSTNAQPLPSLAGFVSWGGA
jgi:hypothetical protein